MAYSNARPRMAVAAVAGLDVRKDFAEVVIEAAERFGLHHLADEAREATKGKGSYTPRARPLPRVELPPVLEHEERTYPPIESVEALLAQCGDVADDDEARTMLEGRALNPYLVDDYRLARVLPKGATLPPWASFWTRTGHRLIVPVYDAQGIVRSVRAWRVVDGDSPKRLPPGNTKLNLHYKAGGLVMADECGRAILTGHQTGAMPIVICEGEPDWMTWALALSDANETPWATFGVLSGAWTQEIADRIPSGSEVNLWTDQDKKGDDYARAVASTLAKRCKVVRR
mgnify:CR=1 FL=1